MSADGTLRAVAAPIGLVGLSVIFGLTFSLVTGGAPEREARTPATGSRQTQVGLPARAGLLTERAYATFGRRFAGVWTDPEDEGRAKIGVVGPIPSDWVLGDALLVSLGIAGDVVAVPRSYVELKAADAWIGGHLGAANINSKVPIAAGIQTENNVVLMTVPPHIQLTKRQEAFIWSSVKKYGNALRVAQVGQIPTTLPCRGVFCSPPLRGGVQIYSDITGCTGAFIGRRAVNGALVQMTAGHCQTVWDRTWLTSFVDGTEHVIGKVISKTFSEAGDAGAVLITNPSGFSPRAWVVIRGGAGVTNNQAYRISSEGTPLVGTRVCMTGGTLHASSCGRVTRVGVSVTYIDHGVTVRGLVEASMCAFPGDSGAPVFANHIAYGIVSGRLRLNPCATLFQPIKAAEALTNVNVSHEAG